MKETIITIAVFTLLIFMIPFVVFAGGQNLHDRDVKYSSSQSVPEINKTFTVYNAKTGKIFRIDALDYVCGVVAAEEPASFQTEALRALAVAVFTNAVHHRENNRDGSNSAYHGADVSTDYTVCMAYLSKEEAKAKWGKKFEGKWSKIQKAVDSVAYKAMVYNDKPISAVFCSMSSGVTESSKDVWGSSRPYLVEVSSVGDTLSPGYRTTVKISRKDFKKKVEEKYKKASFQPSPSKWIGGVKRSDAGGVISATVCGVKLKGTEIRALFGLRSTNFTVSYQKGTFTFAVKGNGHGVGMSQYGSNYMAKKGSTYEEILKWYYPGVNIVSYQWKG